MKMSDKMNVVVYKNCCPQMWDAHQQGTIDSNGASFDADDERFKPYTLVQNAYEGKTSYFPINFCPFCGQHLLTLNKT
jgi:hypothetical protein